jgi:hypothetical protein
MDGKCNLDHVILYQDRNSNKGSLKADCEPSETWGIRKAIRKIFTNHNYTFNYLF